MFEKASRLKLRFTVNQGTVSVEHLWGLHLTDLDKLAIQLKHEIDKKSDSFLVKKPTQDEVLELQFEIVKHIIKVRLKEQEEFDEAVRKEAVKDTLRRLKEEKELETLRGLSVEEIDKKLKEL